MKKIKINNEHIIARYIGYFINFKNPDQYGISFGKNSFSNHLKKEYNQPVLMLNHRDVIGKVNGYDIDENGYIFEVDIYDNKKGREAFYLIDNGLIQQTSFAYTLNDECVFGENNLIENSKIFDVSFVRSSGLEPGTIDLENFFINENFFKNQKNKYYYL